MSSIHPENTNHINDTAIDYDEPVAPARFDTNALRQAKPVVPITRRFINKPKSSILIVAALLAALLGGILGSYLSIRYMNKQADPETSVAESTTPQEPTENPQSDNTTKSTQADKSSGSTSLPEARTNKQEQPTNQTRKEKDKAEKKEPDNASTQETTAASDTPNQHTGRESRELQEAFYNWLEANKQGDINRQMRYYNSKVNAFYRWRDANIPEVRAEKSRVLGHADTIHIEASDPDITISPDGQQATIRYRKRYRIEGNEINRTGEVLQELRWKRVNNQWRIVSERDVKVIR